MSLDGPHTGLALLLAGGAALALTLWMRARLAGWVLLPLALLGAFLPPLLSKDLRYVDVHGFMHSSYAYALLNRGVPPEDVLLAGHPLHYPWAQHYLTALVCRGLRVTPADVFLATNVAALLGSMFFVYQTSRRLDADRRTGVCAVLLSLTGTSVLHAGPLQTWVNHLPKIHLDQRLVPLHKYTLANGNPLGFLGFSAFLFFLVRGFGAGSLTRKEWLGLALAAAGLGFLYPIAWLGLALVTGAMCLVHACQHRGGRRLAAGVAAAVGTGSVCAAPYLLAVSQHKAATAALALRLTPGYTITNLFSALCALALPGVALWMRRGSLPALWNQRRAELTPLVAAGVTLLGLYCVLFIPTDSQYKILALGCLALGIAVAPLLRELWTTSATAGLLSAFLLFVPASTFLVYLSQPWVAAEPVHAQGSLLSADDPREEALYAWLRDHARPDAVVADSALLVPALAQRSLYVGLDAARTLPEARDGWGMPASMVLAEVVGQDSEVVSRRRKQVERVFNPATGADLEGTLADMYLECAPREFWIIARTPQQAHRLARSRALERCVASPKAVLYRYRLPLRPVPGGG